jgi:Ca-activated chloride channel family protein
MTLQPIWPWWILGPVSAVALLFLGWRLVRAGRQRPRAVRDKLARAQLRDWLFRSALVLLLLAAALRPGVPTSSIVAEDYGDSAPRLDGVRQDIMAIAEELAGARFALITFDNNATVRMPLTTDTTALDTLVSVLEPQVTDYAKGSSVTVAGTLLTERLRAARDSHPERPRIVYYLGDGEQTSAKAPAPIRVEGGLIDGGAVLGYGTPEGGRMKENTGHGAGQDSDGGSVYIQDRSGDTRKDAVSVIDENRLREIAGQLGVPYVHRSAGDPSGPMMAGADPGTLQRAPEDGSLEGRTELYWGLAALAALLALRESALVLRQWRQLRPAEGVRK